MRGDFSEWNKDRSQNFRGNLHQQGRVLLDRDWNSQTGIFNEWQDTAGRDAFGAGVAAVPAEVPESFKVLGAQIAGDSVKVFLKKGRLWADGLLTELFRDAEPPANPAGADADRTAVYLNPPPGSVDDLSVNSRDAVILETWLEELSAFQMPDLLIEPALGDVDTTERIHTAFRLRLFRLADGQTCDSIIPELRDDFSKKGKLTAKLQPDVAIGGDCPVVQGGGYTGFEHRLYRIEIADTERTNESWFKWSQSNGGLVGRGYFDAANEKVVLKANVNAIVNSGINSFYLEAMEFDEELGHWKVIYGVRNVTLNADQTLSLPAAAGDQFIGSVPPSPAGKEKSYFFRLWNGIERVDEYTAVKDLPDLVGIKLKFDAEGPGKYTPHDFWTFSVRAGEVDNPDVLVDDLPPEGIFYHRVPLAELNWTGKVISGDDIEDCRRPFQPLTKLKHCCTYRVGDGVSSHGDFKSIQDAIDALPKEGGEVCILPGTYEENVLLEAPHNRNVILKGCGRRTVIKAKDFKPDTELEAAIYVRHGQGITIESLAVKAHEEGIGIFLEGEEKTATDKNKEEYLKDIELTSLFVSAASNNAIKAYTAQYLSLRDSVVQIKDKRTLKPAVYLEGDDMLIERSEIRVLPGRAKSVEEALTNDLDIIAPAQMAAGGLQIGGGSERVRIVNNLIINGTGNGISLGRIDLMKENGETVASREPFKPKGKDDDPCDPDDGYIDEDKPNDEGLVAIAGPPLYDIEIRRNRIFNMGRNGIGVATFFSLGKEMKLSRYTSAEKVTVVGLIFVSKLLICENRIERCMNMAAPPIPGKMAHLMGFGGIALSIVESLEVRDNAILDNCRDFREPICGIYVLASLGLKISRNEITEHLQQDYGDLDPKNIKVGPRGGIWAFIALGQFDLLTGRAEKGFQDSDLIRRSSGAHAAQIHDNVVSTPLGRCLTTFVLGDVSVNDNRFTSYGIQPVDIIGLIISVFRGKSLDMSFFIQILALVAGNVFIFDLGSILIIAALKGVSRDMQSGDQQKVEVEVSAATEESAAAEESTAAFTVNQSRYQKGIADLLIKSGLILFTDNQCKLNPQGPQISVALTSILIAGIADVGFQNNQASCDLPNDLLLTNAFLAGGTARVSGNWLKETMNHVALSAVTFGALNSTTDNESVHCLKLLGTDDTLYLDKHNLVLGAFALGLTGDITTDTGDMQDSMCEKNSGFRFVGGKMVEALFSDKRKKSEMDGIGVKIHYRDGV